MRVSKVGPKFWDKSRFLGSHMLLLAQYGTVSKPNEIPVFQALETGSTTSGLSVASVVDQRLTRVLNCPQFAPLIPSG